MSLSDRMAKIVAESKFSKSHTDKGQLPPGFDESTKNMSDKDKTNLLVMMDNVASQHDKIEVVVDEETGYQEVILPISIFHGMK